MAVDGRKEKGMSERAACRDMSEESKGLYSENAILNRYRYHTGKKSVCQSDTDEKEINWVNKTQICFCDAVNFKKEEIGNLRDAFRLVSEDSGIPIMTLLEWYKKHYPGLLSVIEERRHFACEKLQEAWHDMHTDYYKPTSTGLEVLRETTEEEWLEYIIKIKTLDEAAFELKKWL